MSNRPSLLILGSGRHQAFLIRLAEQQGYATVIADNQPGSPGREFCSVQSMVSTTDLDGCRQLAVEHRVSGILTTGTDQPVRVMATLSAELGLPCYISPAGAQIATNKLLQRETLAAAGIPQPRFLTLAAGSDAYLDWDIFPCVVKPGDSQGQRGVKRVENSTALISTIRDSAQFATNGSTIIEEFVEGPEITVTAWLHDGGIAFFSMSDRVTYSRHSLGVGFQHVFPSLAAAPHERQIREMVQRIGQAFGMRQGPLYVQMLISASGPVLVEAAARIGGGHEANLLPHISGFNPLASLLNTLQPAPFAGSPGLNPGTHGLVNFVFVHPGQVDSLHGLPPVNHGAIREGAFYARPGDLLAGVLDGQGRAGYFLTAGNSRAEVVSCAREFYRELRILDTSARNLVFLPDDSELNLPRGTN